MATQAPNVAAPVKARLDWLDIAKGIAIILVIVGHTVENLSPLRHIIFSFHMPLFFILAGYTFKTKPMGRTLSSSFSRLIVPYIMLFFVWQFTHYFMNHGAVALHDIADYALMFFFASGVYNPQLNIEPVGMSWFLVALFCARIMMNATQTFLEKKNAPFIVQGVFYAALAAAGWGIGSCAHIFLPLSLDVALIAMFMMWIGYAAKQTGIMRTFACKWYAVLIALAVWIVSLMTSQLEMSARLYDPFVLALLGAVAGTLLCCQVSMFIEKFTRLLKRGLVFMGKNSMLIYCFHAIDWMIPWSSLPLFADVPLKNIWASALRTAYNTVLALLVKRV